MTKLIWYKGALMACAVAAPPATYVAHKPISRAVHYVRRHISKPAPEVKFARSADTITTDSLPLCVGNMPDIDELVPTEGGGMMGGGGGGAGGGAYFIGGGGSGGGGGGLIPRNPPDSSPGGAVPELSEWAMMLLGLFMVGGAVRRARA